MKKEMIIGKKGYNIPGLNNLSPGQQKAVIIIHGFGSTKENPTAMALAKELPKHGIGTYSFDFPAHGESPVDGEMLRIENCLNDLAVIEEHVHKQLPNAEIVYFSSSFGAYINLIYLATRKHLGRKAFLRCAAVNMPEIFMNRLTPEDYALFEKQGYATRDDEKYDHPLKIVRGFLTDLETHDVFELYQPGTVELAMIHGTKDETVDIVEARKFARYSGAKLTEVEGADHRFLIPEGGMEQVLKTAVQFIKAV